MKKDPRGSHTGPGVSAEPFSSLFEGSCVDRRRELAGVNLLRVMEEAAAKCERGSEDGEDNDGAHTQFPLLVLHAVLGPSQPDPIRKRLMRGPF